MARVLEIVPDGCAVAERPHGVELTVYADEDRLARVRRAFPDVSAVVEPEGWQDAWKSFHRPVAVGPLWIGPPWEDPPAGVTTVRVDPGRAFGTGAHATTRLALEQLLDIERGSLLDVGCGSGVLAIAAAKLGHSPVVALDIDPAALEATEQNAAANDVAVDARLANAVGTALPRMRTTVANISFAIVAALRFRSPSVITSGYFASQRPQLPGYRAADRRTHAGWAADRYERE